jgi:activating signal cointegrator 1
VKALTLWQPWASLVALGHKRVETRCWSTGYRGPIGIHAAKAIPPAWLGASRHSKEFQFELGEVLHESNLEKAVSLLPLGAVLAVARLVDIVPTGEIRDEISQRERIFGNYEEGRFAWFLDLEDIFEYPIFASGRQRLWNWNEPPSARKRFVGTGPRSHSVRRRAV